MEGQCSLTINVVPMNVLNIFCFFFYFFVSFCFAFEVRCKLQGRFSRTEVWMCFKECECVQRNGFYSSCTVFYLRSQYSACPKCWLFRALRRRNSANSQSRYDSYFNTCTSQQSWNTSYKINLKSHEIKLGRTNPNHQSHSSCSSLLL